MIRSIREHWPEYLIEGLGLGFFMLALCLIVTSFQSTAVSNPLLQRFLIGCCVALTAILIVYSPWGKRSGAHLNPAVTLTFFRLKKVTAPDTFFYVLAQFIGAIGGVLLAAKIIGAQLTQPPLNYLATIPGSFGVWIALLAEFIISFLTMLVILLVTNSKKIEKLTGLFVGLLILHYVVLVVPLSGFSMNPARTFGSALPSMVWTSIWVYFVAPLLGMLAAGETFYRLRGSSSVQCAKLHHANKQRCIFCQKPAEI